ncbi:hypothetical protein GGD83_001726 [Rhodoblastus sphagnicola]|nr:hypothetical protein [Rhodoblastus sphagnicola]MBB4197933.1 hypothetical protein [Rhodoblastus sphagnicola]
MEGAKMENTTRRNAFRLFGAALLAGVVANSGEAEAQPYDPYDRPLRPPPPRDDWGRPRRPPPPPPGYGPPPWRRRCWWKETPWGPRKVCR